jgi:hypothetical protein
MQLFPPFLALLDPEDVGNKSLETPKTLYPTTQCNISEDFYLHQHCCGHNLKYIITSSPAFFNDIVYISRNTVESSRNVYNSSVILTACYRLTGKEWDLWRFNIAGNDEMYFCLQVQ